MQVFTLFVVILISGFVPALQVRSHQARFTYIDRDTDPNLMRRDIAIDRASMHMAGKSGLLFVSSDSALAFYEPVSGQVLKLTGPYSGKDFSVSPGGRTVLFGNQIMSLQGQTDGSVSTSVIETIRPGDSFKLNWSPDGREYGYVDHDGSTWIMDLLGNRQQLYKSDAPPDWSQDGRWMAYCDRRGRLWIAESGKPPDWIAQQNRCTASWSPGKNILAYVMFSEGSAGNPTNGTAYLYNPITGRTKEIARSVSGLDWSPDGKLVSIRRITSTAGSDNAYSITIVNPETGQELYLGGYNPDLNHNRAWIEQTDGYIFGRYRFQADLLTKEVIAGNLLDATRDGSKMLVGEIDHSTFTISCRDVKTNTTYSLLHIRQSDTASAAIPDLSGEFSPDSNRIWISDFSRSTPAGWLAGCDSNAPIHLPGRYEGSDPYFSPDSNWLVIEQTHAARDDVSHILLRELKSGQMKGIPAGLDTHSTWFQMPVSSMESGTNSPSEGTFSSTSTLSSRMEKEWIVLLSILLWATALAAILIFIFYRWRSTVNRKQEQRRAQPESPLEDNPVPVAAPGPKHSPDESDHSRI